MEQTKGRIATTQMNNDPGIQVIARAATVLRSLEGQADGLSLTQIAQLVGLARSTVARIVNALREEQFVMAASPASGVRLGPALTRLAGSASVHFDHVTRPIMTELSRAIGETVDLSVLKGQSAVITGQVESHHRLRTVSVVGERFPLYCTANGKAILSVLSDELVERLIAVPMFKLTPNTITKRAELIKAIEACRRIGYAVENEEHTEGICGLATGFLDPWGRAVALSISVPTTRFEGLCTGLASKLLAAREWTARVLNIPVTLDYS
jgi:DNA-binding IclR family transcriptional regulator